jgi:Sec7-like guanine-nucleotide exchange factor
MCEFSQRYCTQNPGVFADPDAAYVLGFSVSTCSPH